MKGEKTWPKPGEILTHRFRRGGGEVQAVIVSVNKENEVITVCVKGKVYTSLSSAAQAVSGWPANGWTYWGLKKQVRLKNKKRISSRASK